MDPKTVLEEVGLKGQTWEFYRHSCQAESSREFHSKSSCQDPKMLLCDEPTGALDYQTGKAILGLLQDMCRQKGMTVVVITHNSALTLWQTV